MTENRNIVAMLENLYLLRKLFCRRVSERSPLHFAQISIMKTIEDNENCTQATIAEQLGVTPASVAVSTKRLQKAGLITKTVDKDDIRCKRLSLTDKGRAAIDYHISLYRDYDELIFNSFSDEEKDQFFGYLSRIVAKMRELEGVDGDYKDVVELSVALHRKVNDMEKDKNNKQEQI